MIDDVNEKAGSVTLSFIMFGKESYKKSIKDIQVCSFHFPPHRMSVLRMIPLLIIGFMVSVIRLL